MEDDELQRSLKRLTEIRQRVGEQEERVAKLRSLGSPTGIAEELLANLKRSLAVCERAYMSLLDSKSSLGGD